MRETFRVAIDLDQTVGGYVEAFRTSVAGQLGVPVEQLDVDPDYYFTQWNIAGRFTEMHSHAVGQDRIMRTMPVFDGAAAALRELDAAGGFLSVVTSRLCVVGLHEVAIGDTVHWLDQVAKLPYHELHALRGRGWTKVETVMFDVLIDDKPEEILAARAAGKVGIVFGDYAYNRHLDGPRATSWDQVPALVLNALRVARTSQIAA